MPNANLFKTIPATDHLGFWANQVLDARTVADFVGLNRQEVARVAGVSPKSVRWDHKIPQEVVDRLTEVAVVCGLVAQFFLGDPLKTKLWFQTRNPLLGNLSPRDMIRYGRHDKLRRFVMDALAESGMEPHLETEVLIGERRRAAPKKAATT